ncbi:Cytochrome P450 709B2, partial [Dichanthelium oligosanthes]
LGATARGGFVRFKADIPTTISKGAPDFCSVYVVNKGKVSSQRNSIRAAPRVSPLRSQIAAQCQAQSVAAPKPEPPSQRWSSSSRGSDPSETPRVDNFRSPFARGGIGNTRKSYADLSHMSMPDSADISFISSTGRRSIDYHPAIPARMSNSSADSYDHSFEMSRTPSKWGGDSFGGGMDHTNFSQTSSSSYSSLGMADDVEAEMKRLRLELKQTMDMYSTACKEALTAKQKASELQRWKMEEEQKTQDSRITEGSAMAMIEREKARAKAAIEAAEASQRIAEMEVQKRITAEKKLLKEAEDRKSRGGGGMSHEVRYRRYSIEEIEQGTDRFNDARKVGEGGYGPVYKGFLDHTQVAIKVLRPDAAQGRSQFQQEVEVLSCIRHPNMVLLLGACPEYGCLVYEYMASGSLDDCLFRRGGGPVIPWQHRFRICAEIATGLLFLHQTKPEPLVHRDLKPGNILLDRNYVSKISDVGLARLVPPSVADTVTQYRMTSTAGTFCYIDPEYQQTGMLGVKSDIYSFGVMLLQIITAKPPMGLTHHVGRALERGALLDMLDPAVPDWPVDEAQCLAEMALRCCELRRKDRPDLGTVVLPELNRLRTLGEDNMQYCGTIRGGGGGGMFSSPFQSNISRPHAEMTSDSSQYPRSVFSSRAGDSPMPPRRSNSSRCIYTHTDTAKYIHTTSGMVEMGVGMGVVAAALAVVLLPWLWAAAADLVWRPHAVARAFSRQGIRGPQRHFFAGNLGEAKAMRAAARAGEAMDRSSHDIVPRVLPHLRAWASRYGKVFLWWSGSRPRLCVGDYGMVRRILSDKAGLFVKPEPVPAIVAMMGMGLALAAGDDWARHRRVVHPAFAMDKLKMMTGAMAACAGEVVRAWEARAKAAASGEVTVEVGHWFMELTADVISLTAFGSSYRQGKEVFLAQQELKHLAFAAINSVRVPGMKYLPTKANVRRWQLERTMRDTLMAIIDERLSAAKDASVYGTDLLGLMLEANAGDGGQSVMSMDEIVDECKTFFFAGHDTTAHLLTWAMFLLGTNPEWQQRLREEVLQECGGADTPLHGDALNKLKLVTMVLYETLRLYGAVYMFVRKAAADVDLCGVKVPKGTVLSIPIAMLHRDEEEWGADAGEFNPLRFRDGVGRAAAHPSALLSFSVGPRSCIGQDFAMLEAKATLALILRRFAFEVAPEYVHAPADFLTLQPLHGLPVGLKLLDPYRL